MNYAEITDPVFRKAVEAIDSGDIKTLEELLADHPRLLTAAYHHPSGDYFQHPYLLWFIADNPIRNEKLASNILDVTRLIISYLKKENPANVQDQLNYTIGLVSTGRIPRESGVQFELLDLLLDAGAQGGGALNALCHGNTGAAEYHLSHGEQLTLPIAAGLNKMEDILRLAPAASAEELLLALTVAAFYGNAAVISALLSFGAEPNGYPVSNGAFHAHATPLHQAVFSGSLESVKLLVEAGAKLDARDKVYNGTPLGWAQHMFSEEKDEAAKRNFSRIAEYLDGKKVQ